LPQLLLILFFLVVELHLSLLCEGLHGRFLLLLLLSDESLALLEDPLLLLLEGDSGLFSLLELLLDELLLSFLAFELSLMDLVKLCLVGQLDLGSLLVLLGLDFGLLFLDELTLTLLGL
jgi:hypothetical protein